MDKKLKAKKKHQLVVDSDLLGQLDRKLELAGDYLFMKICSQGKIFPQRYKTKLLNCRWVHHKDPYLKLGPFKEEQASEVPYAVVFHDILTDNDMDYLITESRPNLSRKRTKSPENEGIHAKHELNSGQKRKIVQKTVQTWFEEVEWPEYDEEYVGDKFRTIKHPILWKLSKRIGLATQLKTTGQHSATTIQVTNYGLGGLCETHIDPHGIMEVTEIPDERRYLHKTGDMVGTFMAWLNEVEAGGGTAYVVPGFEGVVMPKKGAAAFWYDLGSSGVRDQAATHGGCPILKGSKWILNKWMYQYDNFHKFPCYLQPGFLYNPPDNTHYY